MFRRKFYDYLMSWKAQKNHEYLMVHGQRGSGKTFLISEFAKNNYSSFIYLNLLLFPEQKKIFQGALDPVKIYKRIEKLVPDAEFIDHDTLIFIDEIQESENARSALNFLAVANRYDFIAATPFIAENYLEYSSKKITEQAEFVSEHLVEFKSMDFEEFLWAFGVSDETISNLKAYYDRKASVPENVNEWLKEKFRTYISVGGMPEALNAFLQNQNFVQVNQVQQKILNMVVEDATRYARKSDAEKIRVCIESMPVHLSKENTKFKFRTIEKNGSARKYMSVLAFLEDCNFGKRVYRNLEPVKSLSENVDEESFKFYLNDTGLLTSILGAEVQMDFAKDRIKGPVKNGIRQNVIFDVLSFRNFSLGYYRKDLSECEIEFVYEKNGSIIPVDVKSKKKATLSIEEYNAEFEPEYIYRLTDLNVEVSDNVITLPDYMAFFLE